MPLGILPIYVQFEDNGGNSPSVQDLVSYANQYNIQDAPVMGDSNYQFWSHFEVDNYVPTVALVKYDGTIMVKDDIDQVNAQLANAAPPYGGP